MSTRIQRRGGTAAEHESFIGAPREITVDTTNHNLRLHDGTTAGGHPVVMKRDAGELGGFRNKIINGDFEIWQRGETGFASTGYCADRWYWRPSTGGTGTVVKSGVSLGGIAEIPGSPRHYAYINQTVAGAETCYIEQRIEGVETLAGQEATVTAYVKPDAATDIGVSLVQFYGTGGTPSGQVYTEILPAASYPSGSWTRIQVRFTLPSVSGKTLGSDGNDYVALRFNFDPTVVFTVRMTHVCLIKGDATTEDDPFEARHKQQELALCQRYYCKSYEIDTAPGTLTSIASLMLRNVAGTNVQGTFGFVQRFPVAMRTLPTLIAYSPQNGASGFGWDAANSTNITYGFSYASAVGFNLENNSGFAGGNGYSLVHWTADGEL
ncbi:hypothetical protein [Roseibium sp.]|uniref:hyaluronate lyase N-terminal domain-containing protein n=1 Tax=Roseibium sp. TaxID=1936156 RepID=UPI003A974C40